MRYRGALYAPWSHGTCCLYQLALPRSLTARVSVVKAYSTHQQPTTPPPDGPTPPEEKRQAEVLKERALAAVQHVGKLGRQWGQQSARTATASVNHWWERYEEFVGLNEVREAQTKVTEAEAAFMVARGMVRESHSSLETLQGRLKEVRDRLDRVSREEAHYLELATLEHKLLQEERRLRTTYENAEGAEREKFSLFSAAVRGSHEKERARAERTKNWSIIGSVLGALIGVMGSTYVNRVRLQELKSLLLEAQKGPVSLQEALRQQAGNHRSQQDELREVIDTLRVTVSSAESMRIEDAKARQAPPPPPSGPAPEPRPQPGLSDKALEELNGFSQKTQSLLESLQPQIGLLEQGIIRLESELLTVRGLVETQQQATIKQAELQAQHQAELQARQQAEVQAKLQAELQARQQAEVQAKLQAELQARQQAELLAKEKAKQQLKRQPAKDGAAERFLWDSEMVVKSVEESERRLEGHISKNTVYNAVVTYTAAALTVPVLYLVLRGTG